MSDSPAAPRPAEELRNPARRAGPAASGWKRPAFEVIALDCEITAYAPAGDEPLF